ncbi:MAG TPA: hypothetical protein DCQ93_07840 [Bacteroidetes bacterium]|nr:hypothetical protein [Bacteroidota bacterium]
MIKETSQPSSPDPIDKLLSRIIKQVENDEQPVRYANFFQRTIARLIDMLIVAGIAIGISYSAFSFIRHDTPQDADFIINGLTQALPAFGIMLWVTLYSPILESTGGTIGKRIFRIKMVNDDEDRGNLRFLTCAARAWVYLVFIMLSAPALLFPYVLGIVVAPVLPAFASCLFMLFNPSKQCFHDKMFNMICVKY